MVYLNKHTLTMKNISDLRQLFYVGNESLAATIHFSESITASRNTYSTSGATNQFPLNLIPYECFIVGRMEVALNQPTVLWGLVEEMLKACESIGVFSPFNRTQLTNIKAYVSHGLAIETSTLLVLMIERLLKELHEFTQLSTPGKSMLNPKMSETLNVDSLLVNVVFSRPELLGISFIFNDLKGYNIRNLVAHHCASPGYLLHRKSDIMLTWLFVFILYRAHELFL